MGDFTEMLSASFGAILAGASLPLMLGVAIFSAMFRWASFISTRTAIVLPSIVGGICGLVIVGWRLWMITPEAAAVYPSELMNAPEMLISAFVFNGVAAVGFARVVYMGAAKIFPALDTPSDAIKRDPPDNLGLPPGVLPPGKG